MRTVSLALMAGFVFAFALRAQDDVCAPSGVFDAPRNNEQFNEQLARGEYVPGELIVKFKPGVPRAVGESLLAKIIGFLPAGREIGGGATIYSIDKEDPVKLMATILRAFQALRIVEYVEPNYRVFAQATPSDPLLQCECGLTSIHAEAAWQKLTSLSAVTVAVVDTGVDASHKDLIGIVPDGTMDQDGHGTHVAGIIAAIADGKGMVGTTGGSSMITLTSVSFLHDNGIGDVETAADAIRTATKSGAKVLVCAWGALDSSKHLAAAVAEAKAADVLIVAAAGNMGKSFALFPAAYGASNVISVMATTCNDHVPRFSNRGNNAVDIAAPGAGDVANRDILSTVLNQHYSYWQGTSMATAFVAAAAAIVRAQDPTLHAAEVKQVLMKTSDPLKSLKGKCRSGGRLNLENAVTRFEPRALRNRIRKFLRISS